MRLSSRNHAVSSAGDVEATNQLLNALTSVNRAHIGRQLVRVPIGIGDVIYKANRRPRHVYFPETAVLSFIVNLSDGPSVEAAMAGAEGMAGVGALTVNGSSSTSCICQVPGHAQRLEAPALRRLIGGMPQLGDLIQRYLTVFIDQISQTSACNRHHSVAQRCARWLLMTHDRVPASESFSLTQSFLAYMLGIGREAVSDAASGFQRDRLIRYTRGRITILDRRGLERSSCECYSSVENRLRHLYA